MKESMLKIFEKSTLEFISSLNGEVLEVLESRGELQLEDIQVILFKGIEDYNIMFDSFIRSIDFKTYRCNMIRLRKIKKYFKESLLDLYFKLNLLYEECRYIRVSDIRNTLNEHMLTLTSRICA